MNSIFQACSLYILSRAGHRVARSSVCHLSFLSWKTSFSRIGIRAVNVEFTLTTFHVQCYSSRRRDNKSPLLKLAHLSVIEEKKDPLFVVRNADSDCYDQVGCSISFPTKDEPITNITPEVAAVDTTVSTRPSEMTSCILHFHGAFKGNTGQAGAGAILRNADGNLICRLREGLGDVTNNVAEYRAVILGMKCAIKKGFKDIKVFGDSKLVCKQMQKKCRIRNDSLIDLYKEAMNLKDEFLSFEISHVLRSNNKVADAEAHFAVRLDDGEIHEEEAC
ncbi:uncharacterized protein LOC124925876 [Impatiens glandulifera]|uniref:uncharacterized protein LOC124925876 n=1 Tax=Impatiens glandulifera TaxID=253017 RepID=UPI001FB0C2F0|nr:uncharacterized protein LOC124925876 [Impatiens glandulifera]